jgi:endonuclease-3
MRVMRNTLSLAERYKKVTAFFRTHMPIAETELMYSNSYELMVSVILSAQCTDKRVNQITPALLTQFPTISHMALATPEDVFPYIRSCSYPNSKARHLVGMARKVMEDFGGKIPERIEELMTLPGVGRKTANVITLVAFGNPAMPVDTHVFRVSARLGLTTGAKTPEETERQLVRNFAPADLFQAHHWLILHGRYVCLARKPRCLQCGLQEICVYYQAGSEKSHVPESE